MSIFQRYEPDTLGCQFFPRYKAAQPINSPSNAGAVRWTATDSVQMNDAWVYLTNVSQVDTGQGSGWEMEFYDTEDLGVVAKTVGQHRPISDVRKKGPVFGFSELIFGGALPFSNNIYRAIDSTSLTPGTWPNTGQPIDNNELLFPLLVPGIESNGYEVSFLYGGLNGTYNDKRITRVSVCARVQEYVDIAFVTGMTITPYIMMRGVRYMGPSQTFNGEAPGGHEVRATWSCNPYTRVSWKVPDINAFQTGASPVPSAGWIVNPTGSANNLATILQGWLEVEFTNDAVDPRLAFAPLLSPQPGWNRMPIWSRDNTTILGEGGLDLVSGHEYLAVLRQRCGDARLSWRYVDGRDDLDHITPEHVDTPVTTWTADSFVLAGIADVQTRYFAFALSETSVGDFDPNMSQPYAHVDDDVEPKIGLDYVWTLVNEDRYVGEGLLPVDDTTEYEWVRALVKAENGLPDAPLTFQVFNQSNIGSTASGTFVVQPSDLVGPIDGWQIVEGKLSAPAILDPDRVGGEGDGTYWLNATSPATPGSGWRVQVLSAQLIGSVGAAPGDIVEVTYGADDARAVVEGSAGSPAENYELDAALSIATMPDPPESMSVALVVLPCFDNVAVSWAPTDLDTDVGGGFRRYEVERMDDRTVWRRIAEPTDEDAVEMVDEEVRSNVETTYRVRVRRMDWSASDWTESEPITPTQTCCGYVFGANAEPDRQFWADDMGEIRGISFPENVTMQQYEGRKYTVGHRSLDDQGASFQRTLLLAHETAVDGTLPTSTPGQRTFDPVLDIRPSRGNGAPYTCVRAENGDRWFATVTVSGEANQEEPGGAYSVQVTVTEATDRPYPIDIEVA